MLQCICTFGVHACAPVYMHVHQEVGAHACTLVYVHFVNNSGCKCIYTSVYALLFTYSANGCLGINYFEFLFLVIILSITFDYN